MKNADLKPYILPFIIIFTALAALFNPSIITAVWSKLSAAAAPVILGIIFAAVISPAVEFAEKKLCRIFGKRLSGRNLRGCAIAAVYLLILGAAVAAISIIIPSLIDSVTLFANSFDAYYSDFRERYDNISDRSIIISSISALIDGLSEKLPAMLRKTFSATAGFIRALANIVIGAVLSVYILADKNQLTAFISSAAKAVLSEKAYRRYAEILYALNDSLVRFISGQLTEAFVLGSCCFIGMVILGFEYPLLISTIIGVTALIPVAGAFVGAVPSALMLFLIKPVSALWFIIFIIVLQLLENNLIYPRIVGKSVGLPPILILTAIVTGAAIGGAWGIMLGIPIISAIYVLTSDAINRNSAHKSQ